MILTGMLSPKLKAQCFIQHDKAGSSCSLLKYLNTHPSFRGCQLWLFWREFSKASRPAFYQANVKLSVSLNTMQHDLNIMMFRETVQYNTMFYRYKESIKIVASYIEYLEVIIRLQSVVMLMTCLIVIIATVVNTAILSAITCTDNMATLCSTSVF